MFLRRQGVCEAKATEKRWIRENGRISQYLRKARSQERSVGLEWSSSCVSLSVSMFQKDQGVWLTEVKLPA